MKEIERHYFVDEAGDLTLFNRYGTNIIGNDGCSKYFMLGVALIENPHLTRQRIESLRTQILSDPYLASIPSLQKTAICFHAKDDCAEVKMEFFKMLSTLPIKIYCIVRRKSYLIEDVHRNNHFNPEWRYNQNQVYDACVKRLFKDRLHSSEINHVTFARRGKSDRNFALSTALEKAKQNFEKSSGRLIVSDQRVILSTPSQDPCLQVIDYFLWSLQRIYERQEDRFFNFVKSKFRRIIDLDDKRFKEYGVYYDENNELTLKKIEDSLKKGIP